MDINGEVIKTKLGNGEKILAPNLAMTNKKGNSSKDGISNNDEWKGGYGNWNPSKNVLCEKKGSWEIRYLKLQTIELDTLVGKYGNP